ncbi:pilus assembly protein TadG-related protein [Cumulibacter manganitolerans]|uniref:pilus assembly protein TadG-related protein n=1 Tax=Cumulibacter manganitolerans TaxID=1884992 RepID=UPI001294DA56|nr:pilus assembly protein TadG-related protein [Cumulibacter manganitolerans]
MKIDPSTHRHAAPDSEQGSTIPLLIGFFMLAGLLLTGGVVAGAAFVQLRSLQSACDGAAIAAANGFERGGTTLGEALPFDPGAARAAVATYAVQAWGAEAAQVDIGIDVVGEQVVVRCARTAHVPFETVFAPGGVHQVVTATSRAPLQG